MFKYRLLNSSNNLNVIIFETLIGEVRIFNNKYARENVKFINDRRKRHIR